MSGLSASRFETAGDPPYQEQVAAAAAAVAEVADDPIARYRSRAAFYCHHGSEDPFTFGYGASELAFLRWAIRRGLFNPIGAARPGSRYWRAVNDELIYWSSLAAALHRRWQSPVSDERLRGWLDFLHAPSAIAWYEAHNLTLVETMRARRAEAECEDPHERRFIYETFRRVIYAEAMVRGCILSTVGRRLADPRGGLVEAILGLPALYPRSYPARRHALELGLARLIDAAGMRLVSAPREVDALVLRRMRPLVPADIDDAELLHRFAVGEPVYPECRPPGARR
jgi:hypothetical protein